MCGVCVTAFSDLVTGRRESDSAAPLCFPMFVEAIGWGACAGYIAAAVKFTLDAAARVYYEAYGSDSSAGQTQTTASDFSLQPWWSRQPAMIEEARLRGVPVSDVLHYLMIPLKRKEAARKIQSFVRSRRAALDRKALNMACDYESECDDDSDIGSDSDDEEICPTGSRSTERVVATRIRDPTSILGREAIRVMLFHLNGGEEPEEGTVLKLSLQRQVLFEAHRDQGIFKVKAGLQLVTAGRGMQIVGCGSEHFSGGGRAVLNAAKLFARGHDIPFFVLRPMDAAARSFWIHSGFSELVSLRGLWQHRNHQNCRCYMKHRQNVTDAVARRCAERSLDVSDFICLLLRNTSLLVAPLILWL